MSQENENENDNLAVLLWKYRAFTWSSAAFALILGLSFGGAIRMPSGIFGFLLATTVALAIASTKLWIDALRTHKKFLWF